MVIASDFPIPVPTADTSSEGHASQAVSERVLQGGLEPHSPSPLHVQLASIMRLKIESHEWDRGSYIPSENEMMARFGVSRGTVRRAVATLADEGFLVTRKGSGTRVATDAIARPDATKTFSFAASLRDSGVSYTTKVLAKEVVPAPFEVAERLKGQTGDPVLFMRRVRMVKGHPVVCQESWSNLLACPNLDVADFTSESLFDAVERCSGRHVTTSLMRYSAKEAGEEHGAYLGCQASEPLIVLEQNIRLEDGTPIEWSRTWLGPHQSIASEAHQVSGLSSLLGEGPSYPTGFEGVAASSAEMPPRRRLELLALDIRRGVIEWGHRYEGSAFHFGGALSMAEIVAVLYGAILHTGLGDVSWEERDRLIVSKAHACIALYPAMLKAGLLSQDDIDHGLFGPKATIFKHPRRDPAHGFEMSGGSLGMGLGYAAGIALAQRRRRLGGRIFCVVGDGECDEGSIWESAALVGHKCLNNLTVIVDANGMQLDGPTSDIIDNGPIQRKFASFGFEPVEVDGHDVLALFGALAESGDRPRVVVARTVKGKGLSFAEGIAEWHDKALTEELYLRALAELDAQREAILNA